MLVEALVSRGVRDSPPARRVRTACNVTVDGPAAIYLRGLAYPVGQRAVRVCDGSSGGLLFWHAHMQRMSRKLAFKVQGHGGSGDGGCERLATVNREAAVMP